MIPTRELLKRPHPLLGVHDPNSTQGGGWTLVTVEVGHDPTHHGGGDFRAVLDKGRRPIVRINNGYEPRGTIPQPQYYEAFSVRVANYVQASQGCDVWIVGNEPNCGWERPDGQAILPSSYARCYDLCREAIHRLDGHGDDLVLFAPVGPWNSQTQYAANQRGDWLQYFTDAQKAAADVDGFAMHAYGRAQDTQRLTQHIYMSSPGWENHHWEFHVFEDWARSVLPQYKDRLKFLTEFDANEAWVNENRGYIGQAVQEVYLWNKNRPTGHAPFVAFIVYRWDFDKWRIKDKPNLLADYNDAIARNLTSPELTEPGPEPDPDPPEDDYERRITALENQAAQVQARVVSLEGQVAQLQATMADVLDRLEFAGTALMSKP